MNEVLVRCTSAAIAWAAEVMDGPEGPIDGCGDQCRGHTVAMTPGVAASWWLFCTAAAGAMRDNGEYSRAASLERSADSAARALAAAGIRYRDGHWLVEPASDADVLAAIRRAAYRNR